MRGTVKWFNGDKRYGFIVDGDGNDWFFHHSSLVMDGNRFTKRLFTDDIVEFKVGIGKNGREQALNVTPILTIQMVEDALKKDNLYLQISEDDSGVCLYRVVNENDILQTDEQGMTLVEVAAYAGIDVEGIMEKSETPVIKDCAEKFAEAFHTKVLADVVTEAIEKVIDKKEE